MGKKTKKKTIEQSSVRKGSPMEGVGLWWEGFKERYLLSLEWKIVGVMDKRGIGSEFLWPDVLSVASQC